MKSVLLTGCGRGIGKAILNHLLAAQIYRIFGVSKTIDKSLRDGNPDLSLYECDLANLDQTMSVLSDIMVSSGGIDILINNAGIGLFRPVEALSNDDWTAVINLNLSIPFIFMRHVLPRMKERNFGRIINISSDADYIGFAGGAAYCASKFGLRGLSDSVREELRGRDITVTTIAPGRVDTFFNGKMPGDRPNSLSPDDVASQVMHVLQQGNGCCIERIYLRSTKE